MWSAKGGSGGGSNSPLGTPSKHKGVPWVVARASAAAAAMRPPAPPPPLLPPPPPLPPPLQPPVAAPRPARWPLPAPLRLLWSSGLACGLAAAALGVGGNLLVKDLSPPAPPLMQVVLTRALFSLGLTLALAAAARTELLTGRRPNRPFLVARGLLGAAAMACWYASLGRLPLGDAVAVSLIGPPLTALLAFALLGEALGAAGVAGCLAAFVGVVVVSRPPFLFGDGDGGGGQATAAGGAAALGSSSGGGSRSQHAVGVATGALGALAGSGAMIAIRRIGGSEPAIVVTLAFHACSAALGAGSLLLGVPAPPRKTAPRNTALVAGVGAVAFCAQLLVTRSYQLLPAAIAASLSFTAVAYSYAAGAALFGEKVTLPAALGTALISLGVALVTVRRPRAGVARTASKLPGEEAPAAGGGARPGPLSRRATEAGSGGSFSAAAAAAPSTFFLPPLTSRRVMLVTQHSITPCGDGGAVYGSSLFVAVDPPAAEPEAPCPSSALFAADPDAGAPPAPPPPAASCSPFAYNNGGGAQAQPAEGVQQRRKEEEAGGQLEEPTVLEALAADPLVAAAARLFTRAISIRRNAGSAAGGGISALSRGPSRRLSRGPSVGPGPALLRQISSLLVVGGGGSRGGRGGGGGGGGGGAENEGAGAAAAASAGGPAPAPAALRPAVVVAGPADGGEESDAGGDSSTTGLLSSSPSAAVAALPRGPC